MVPWAKKTAKCYILNPQLEDHISILKALRSFAAQKFHQSCLIQYFLHLFYHMSHNVFYYFEKN